MRPSFQISVNWYYAPMCKSLYYVQWRYCHQFRFHDGCQDNNQSLSQNVCRRNISLCETIYNSYVLKMKMGFLFQTISTKNSAKDTERFLLWCLGTQRRKIWVEEEFFVAFYIKKGIVWCLRLIIWKKLLLLNHLNGCYHRIIQFYLKNFHYCCILTMVYYTFYIFLVQYYSMFFCF